MDDIITGIKSVTADSGLTSNAFALKVGMNSSNLSRKLNGKVPVTSRDYRLICDSIGVNKDWQSFLPMNEVYAIMTANGQDCPQRVRTMLTSPSSTPTMMSTRIRRYPRRL